MSACTSRPRGGEEAVSGDPAPDVVGVVARPARLDVVAAAAGDPGGPSPPASRGCPRSRRGGSRTPRAARRPPADRGSASEDDPAWRSTRCQPFHLSAASAAAVRKGSGSQGPTYARGRRGGRGEPVERQVGDRPTAGLRMLDGAVHRAPSLQPGVLHDVPGVGDAAQQLVGRAEQQSPVLEEDVVHPSAASPDGLGCPWRSTVTGH